MCKTNPKTYRVILNSADKINGDNQSGQYLIKLPFVVGNGMVHAESFDIEGTLTGINAIKVSSSSFSNPYVYETDNNHHHVIGRIPIDAAARTAGALSHYNKINSTDVGYQVNNFSLDNQTIGITLTNEENTTIAAGNITNFQLTLVFVDNAETSDRVGGYRM